MLVSHDANEVVLGDEEGQSCQTSDPIPDCFVQFALAKAGRPSKAEMANRMRLDPFIDAHRKTVYNKLYNESEPVTTHGSAMLYCNLYFVCISIR